jgi:tetratricopeptide (TPR) repeat protein
MERMGQLKDAQVQYEKTVRENPRAAVASYKLAAMYADQDEKLNFALDLANAARKQLPEDPAVSDVLGWLYVRKKQPALGVPALESAVKASPNNAIYRYHLGVAYARTGKPPQAREELTRALQIDKGFAYAAQARETLASIAK